MSDVSPVSTLAKVMESTKVCSKCKVEKPIIQFYKRKDRPSVFGACKECCNKNSSKYWFNNVEKVKKHKRLYCSKNKEHIKIKVSQYYFNHKKKLSEINKQYFVDNKESMDQWKREYSLKNKDKIQQYSNQWRNKRWKTDLNYKIRCCCRNRIYKALKLNRKSTHAMEMVGCTVDELRKHIEKQWLVGMSWDNWGWGSDKWNIDHIIPCAFFDLSDPVEQHMCFRWENMQPMWQPDNFKKGDRINRPH